MEVTQVTAQWLAKYEEQGASALDAVDDTVAVTISGEFNATRVSVTEGRASSHMGVVDDPSPRHALRHLNRQIPELPFKK